MPLLRLGPGCCKDPEAYNGLESLLRRQDCSTAQVPCRGWRFRYRKIRSPGTPPAVIFQPWVHTRRFLNSGGGTERPVTREQLVLFALFTSRVPELLARDSVIIKFNYIKR